MPELIKTRWYPESVLKAYYRFESGALTTDSSGEGHTLTAISDPAEDASGKFGGAVAFDGNDAYSATNHADFKPTGNFTIGLWVKISSAGSSYLFQSYSNNGAAAGINMNCSATGYIGVISGKNTGTTVGTDYVSYVGTNYSVNDGNWHFAVVTWDGSKVHIYVDGAEDGTGATWDKAPAYAATNYVRVGCRNRTGTNEIFLTGSLDDVFILNGKALSDYEVLSIYRTISPGAFLMNLATNWKNN